MKMQRAVWPVVIGLVLMAGALLLLPAGAGAAPGDAPLAAPLAAQTALTVTEISRAGVTDTLAAANADGNRFNNNGRVFVEIANGSGGTITATFVTPGTVDGLAIADLAVAVPTGYTKLVGPFPPSLYNVITGTYKGFVYVTYSAVTTVTVGAWRLP